MLILLVAFGGVFFAVLPAGAAVQKATILACVLLTLVLQFRNRFSRQALSLIFLFIAYLVLAFYSAYTSTDSILYTLAAMQPLLLGLLLYLAFVSVSLDAKRLQTLQLFVIATVAVQIFFACIKLVTHGVDEKVLIGTMSHAAGQLGFMIPAIAVPLLMFMLTPRNRLLIYALVAGMFAFGVINEKRSIVFLLPIVIFASLLANRPPREAGARRRGPSFVVVAAVIVAGVFIGLRTIPSLNLFSSYSSGDVSLAFAFEYAKTYVMMDYGGPLQASYAVALSDENVQVGRVILLLHIGNWLYHADPMTFWFGAGFGAATPSEWIDGGSDPLFELVGSRGAISGAGLALVETGVVGLSLISGFFIWLLVSTIRDYRASKSLLARRWYRTVFILFGVFWYDFFFYSTVLLRTMPLPVIFFAIVASIPLVRNLVRVLPRGDPTRLPLSSTPEDPERSLVPTK
jgi:hypothetical protein